MHFVDRAVAHRRGRLQRVTTLAVATMLSVGLIVVGGGTVAHAAAPSAVAGAVGDRVVGGECRHARRRPPLTATPAPAGRARSAIHSGSRSTSAPQRRISQVVPGLAELVRRRVLDPGVQRRRSTGRPSTPRPPAPAAPRASPSPAPAGTSGCTRPPGTPRTATRCGSSRSTAPSSGPAAPRPTSPPTVRRPRLRPRTTTTTAAAAFDADLTTRWSSAFSDPQWLQVDLGRRPARVPGPAQLAELVRHRASRSRSPTPVRAAGRRVYSTTAGTGGTQTLGVAGTGRYVRMYGTARAHGVRVLAL